jgi:hypothetical protein
LKWRRAAESARRAISFYIGVTQPLSGAFRASGVKDQFFFGEELEPTVAFRVNGVSEAVVNGWKHGNDRSALVVVGCIIDQLANCELRHWGLLPESSKIRRSSPLIG